MLPNMYPNRDEEVSVRMPEGEEVRTFQKRCKLLTQLPAPADQAEDAQETGKAALPASLCGGLQLWQAVQRAWRAAATALPGSCLGHGPNQHCC